MIKFLKHVCGLSLKARVMAVLNQRIEQAEKAMEAELSELGVAKKKALLTAKVVYKNEVQAIKDIHTANTCEVADKHVNSILAKVI